MYIYTLTRESPTIMPFKPADIRRSYKFPLYIVTQSDFVLRDKTMFSRSTTSAFHIDISYYFIMQSFFFVFMEFYNIIRKLIISYLYLLIQN